MNNPEPIAHFVGALLSSKAVLNAIRDCYGEETEAWIAEARDQDSSLLETFILDNKYQIAPNPVQVLKAVGAYDEPFEVRIYQIGPIFWVAAVEFKDAGYFQSLSDTVGYAKDEYSCFLNPPNDDDE